MSGGWQAQARRAAAMGILTLILAGCGGGGRTASDAGDAAPRAAVPDVDVAALVAEDSAAAARAEAAGLGAAPATEPPPDAKASPVTGERLAAAMNPNDVRRLLERNPDVLLLDVRQPEEWTPPLGHIEGAKLIPLPELNARIGEVAEWRERPIVLVCRSGRRSEIARKALAGAGFTNVANMSGGMIEWRRTE